MPEQKPLKVVDLFAGCGGLTEGFEQTQLYKTIGMVEWDKQALTTLENRLETKWGYNNVSQMSFCFDMQRTDELLHGWQEDGQYGSSPGILEALGPEQPDIIIGGPPCQAYSIAGRVRDEHGMKKDYRNYLFETYIRVVDELQPKAFVFENVPGMLSAAPGGVPISHLIAEAFNSIGYEIHEELKETIVEASEYGVPQYRKRLIIVGLNKAYFGDNTTQMLRDFYFEVLPTHKTKRVTAGQALKNLPKMKVVNNHRVSHEVIGATTVPNHTPRFHNKRDIEIFQELATDANQAIQKYDSIEKLKTLYTEKTGKTSNVHKYNVIKPDKPSNAIVAHLYKDGLRHIHPDPTQGRSITVREAARLQSFPDDFIFLGGMGAQYKMIGNAVPPKLAKAIGGALHTVLSQYSNGSKKGTLQLHEHPTNVSERQSVCA